MVLIVFLVSSCSTSMRVTQHLNCLLQVAALSSVGYFFSQISAAKQALTKHNESVIKAMVSTLKRYDIRPDDHHEEPVASESHARDQQRIRGVLPISPTMVRVKTPRVVNYLGFG